MNVYLVTSDMHLRTAVNRVLDSPAITCKSSDCLFSRNPAPSAGNNDVIIIDGKFDGINSLFVHLLSAFPRLPVMVLLPENSISEQFLNEGRLYLVSRPLSARILTLLTEKQSATSSYDEKLETLIYGSSEAMMKIRKTVSRLADNDYSVFISGETGTGKEVVAKAIHTLRYPSKEMVSENCSLLDCSLMESLLFGHSRGSFTGAVERTEGLVEKANGSTLFLDEVEELSLSGQAKLLRLLESGEYRPLGETRLHYSRFSLISASNVSKDALFAVNRLRKDFFHRISNIIINIPPLRERIEDIPQLVHNYEIKQGYEDHITEFDLFFTYSWPGNVRELFAAVDRIHFFNPEHLKPRREHLEI
jgi:Response regulator containing CheY-like receiver, AAA-type ATPase, and DNA-binding domains